MAWDFSRPIEMTCLHCGTTATEDQDMSTFEIATDLRVLGVTCTSCGWTVTLSAKAPMMEVQASTGSEGLRINSRSRGDDLP